MDVPDQATRNEAESWGAETTRVFNENKSLRTLLDAAEATGKAEAWYSRPFKVVLLRESAEEELPCERVETFVADGAVVVTCNRIEEQLTAATERATSLAEIVNGYYEGHYEICGPQLCQCRMCLLSRNEKPEAARDAATVERVLNQHVCGSHGFGLGPDDRCDACDREKAARAGAEGEPNTSH